MRDGLRDCSGQASLRDAGCGGFEPWTEVHGYRHALALRGGSGEVDASRFVQWSCQIGDQSSISAPQFSR